MPIPACLLPGRRTPSKSLAGLLIHAVAPRLGPQQSWVCFQRPAQRWAHVAAHHEAAVEHIRNIGIIAHVDAVSGPVPRLRSYICSGSSVWLTLFPGQNHHNRAYALL